MSARSTPTLAVSWSTDCTDANCCSESCRARSRVLEVADELRLVLRFFSLCLIERRLEKPRIDGCEQFVLLDLLAFLEVHPVERAIHAAAQLHGIEGLNGADAGQLHRDVCLAALRVDTAKACADAAFGFGGGAGLTSPAVPSMTHKAASITRSIQYLTTASDAPAVANAKP